MIQSFCPVGSDYLFIKKTTPLAREKQSLIILAEVLVPVFLMLGASYWLSI